MNRPLICLTLTSQTLKENAMLCERYAKYVDIAELRVDFLTEDEQLEIRKFPSMIQMPCILTIRREGDDGKFNSSEFSRTALFGRALASASKNPSKNYAYVDFEDDYHISGLEDSALAFGVKIIRSVHHLNGPVQNIRDKCLQMRKTGFEIPKIAFNPKTLSDVTNLFKEAKKFDDFDHILCALGILGTPSRILSSKLNSYLTYVTPKETAGNLINASLLDPVTLTEIYNFRSINEDTEIFAITGNQFRSPTSILLHNAGFRSHGMNKIFIPLPSTSISESLQFAEETGISGLSVTYPYNREILYNIEELDSETAEINSANTIIRKNGRWIGYQTAAYGFQKALSQFIGFPKLHKRKVAIIGAGGAAAAVAYVVKAMGGKACIFNRSRTNAKMIADRYGFLSAPLGIESLSLLEKYSDIIIQTTSVGMNNHDEPSKENNPIWYYQFKGHENVFDIIYTPEQTPLMKVALNAGCHVTNGLPMLKYQSYRQFKHFTGQDYESSDLSNKSYR